MIGRETSAYPSTAVVVASSIASTPSTIALLTPMAASSAPRGASRPLILCLNIYFYIPTTKSKHAKSIPKDLSLSPHLSLSLLLGICSLKSFLKLSNWSMFNLTSSSANHENLLEALVTAHAGRLPHTACRELDSQLVPVQLRTVQLAQQIVDLPSTWKQMIRQFSEMVSSPIPASTWTKPKFLSVITSASTTRP